MSSGGQRRWTSLRRSSSSLCGRPVSRRTAASYASGGGAGASRSVLDARTRAHLGGRLQPRARLAGGLLANGGLDLAGQRRVLAQEVAHVLAALAQAGLPVR